MFPFRTGILGGAEARLPARVVPLLPHNSYMPQCPQISTALLGDSMVGGSQKQVQNTMVDMGFAINAVIALALLGSGCCHSKLLRAVMGSGPSVYVVLLLVDD